MKTIAPIVILSAACVACDGPAPEDLADIDESAASDELGAESDAELDTDIARGGDPGQPPERAAIEAPTPHAQPSGDAPLDIRAPEEGRCPGWSEAVLELACEAARSGRVVAGERQSLMWTAVAEFDAGATLVRVDLPDEPIDGATSLVLNTRIPDGPRASIGRAAAIFAVDNDFQVVDRSHVGATPKAAIDVSSCDALRGGWALDPDELASPRDSWSVVLEPPSAMATRSRDFDWGESMQFVVVTHVPRCAAANEAAAKAEMLAEAARVEIDEKGPGPCVGG